MKLQQDKDLKLAEMIFCGKTLVLKFLCQQGLEMASTSFSSFMKN